MAFPTRYNVTTWARASAATTHDVDYPADIQADNLLICFFAVYGSSPNTVTDPGSPWLELDTSGMGGTFHRGGTSTIIRKLTGSESGTFQFTTSGSGSACALMYQYSGWGGTLATDVDIAGAVRRDGSAPDPSADVTAGWGADDNTFLEPFFAQDDNATIVANPTDYVDEQYVNAGAASNASCEIGCAEHEVAAATDASSPWTISESEDNRSHHMVIKPGSAGGGGGEFTGPFPIAVSGPQPSRRPPDIIATSRTWQRRRSGLAVPANHRRGFYVPDRKRLRA